MKKTIRCPYCGKQANGDDVDDWYYCMHCNKHGKLSDLNKNHNIDVPDFMKDIFGFK